MSATTPKIYFNEATYAWLLALTRPGVLPINATLQEYAAMNERRDIHDKIEFMRNKQ